MNHARHSGAPRRKTPWGASRNPVTDHLDLWTSALLVKSTAGRGGNGRLEAIGIRRLRELILELAVRGKLIPQDPSDEPAKLLLDKLSKKREGLIKAKEIRRAKLARDSELPTVDFKLPAGWALVQLSDLLLNPSDDIVDGPFGSRLKATEYVEAGVPIIRIQNIDRNFFKIEGLQYVTAKKAIELRRHSFVSGDIVLNKLGDPAGKACMVPSSLVSGIVVADIVRVRLDENLHDKQYFVNCMNSPFVANQFGGLAKGVTRQRVNLSQVRALSIPVPPLNEQHRIVAKVDELMALCDQLEQQQGRGIEAHQTLVETLLGTLTRVESAREFTAAWNRIVEHFDTLFTTEHSIDQLKQTILQLAVMGKLALQKPSDEPAAVLLQRIAAEKSRLVKAGEIAKSKPLPAVADEEQWFDLPANWSWTRFDELALHSEAGWSPSCESVPRRGNGWGVLKVSAVTWGKFDANENKALPVNLEPKPDFEVKPGDFLISRANTAELVARVVVVPDGAPPRLMMSDKIIRFVFSSEVSREYLSLVNGSERSREYYARVAGGTSGSMKNVSREQIRNLAVALPPLAEQHRIVAKVDELMALCDALKARLAEAQTTQIHLADAIVEQAVTVPDAVEV